MQIRTDNLGGAAIQALLQEHLNSMHLHSPPESVHALDLTALRKPEITFWTAWEGGDLLGCGALKQLSLDHGELKSMRTATTHLRKGVAGAMLRHILDHAQSCGLSRVSLETGTHTAFAPARQLYAIRGFVACDPFEGYVRDPHSVFMTKTLANEM
jgi:putative acetyltransferase